MALRIYDVLENFLVELDECLQSSHIQKEDVIQMARDRTLLIMRHVVVTPLIGEEYAFPGDLEGIHEWIKET